MYAMPVAFCLLVSQHVVRAMWLSVALAFLVVGCRDEPLPAVKPPGPEDVFLEQVVSEPDRFDGVLVRVSGTAHALWLDLGWPVSNDTLSLNGEDIQQRDEHNVTTLIFVADS